MMFAFRKSLIAAAVSLALPTTLYATDQPQSQQSQRQSQQSSPQGGQSQKNLSQIRATQVKDMKVVGSDGKEIGEISEIVVDVQSGRVHAAVVEFGGFMGVGEKQYAFPVSELKAAKGNDRLMLNVDRQKLQNAEGFAKNQWPAMGDDYWGRVGAQGKASAGSSPPSQMSQRNLMRVSELIGKDVEDKNGRDVGEVKDVVLDLSGGRVRNVVLQLDDGGRVTVPPKTLSSGTGDKLLTGMPADQLRRQARTSDAQASQGASASGTQSASDDVDNAPNVLGPTEAGQGPLGGPVMDGNK